MGDLIEEVDEKQMLTAMKQPSTEGLIEFVKMEDRKLIPIQTKMGKIYIRKPNFEDNLATMRLRKEYEDLTEEDFKQVKGVFTAARLIVKPAITFEELIQQPTDIFIEVASKIAEKMPSISLELEDEDDKKKSTP